VGIVAALVVGSALGYLWPSLNTPANPPQVSQISSCVKPPGYFLIVADIHGFNNSVGHIHDFPNEPWPVLNVKRGDRVNILVCNEDDYSPHGFAIEHYFDGGTALMPHESFRLSIVADQVGTFTIYCNIFCPVHAYMLSGQLVVAE
jgi:hypothetical protein